MTDSFHPPVLAGKDLSQASSQGITEADVLITDVLASRPARQPDLAAENQALRTLAQHLMDDPQSMLKTLVRLAIALCRADTVGVSLLETTPDGESIFRWVAIAGALESLEQGTTPGNFSPCGTTLACNQPQLYSYPERFFTYLYHPQFPVVEGLLIPLQVNDQALGTLWILSHHEARRFDAEDQRLMMSLGGFITSALYSLQQLQQTAATALRQSEEFNLQLLDSSEDCIKVLDLEGRLLFMSRAGQMLLGINEITPFLNISWAEFWQGTDQQVAIEAIAKARAGEVFTFQGYRPTLKGEPKWWDNKISPIRGTDGQVERLLCISRDITDRRQTEVALRESEAKYRTLFESMDEGFCLIEVLFDETGIADDYRFLEANPAFERHTGLVDAVGKTARELVPQLDAHWFEIYGKIALTGGPERFENPAKAMGRFFDVYAFRVGEPHEHKVAILFNDISERKRIEAERKQIEQERDRFFAVGSDLQVIMSSHGHFQWVSPAFERILGWTPDEMTSRPWINFLHPDDISASVAESVSVLSGAETFAFENRYRHRDGSYRWLLWRAQPHLEEQVLYAAAVDITARKQVEIALRQSEEHYRTLFESIDEGFCTIEVLFDADGKPFDHRILQANPSFERQSSIANPEGKRASELALGGEQYWNDLYAQVIHTGESIRAEVRSDAFDRWFDILVSRVGDAAMRQVAIVFTDISDRKQAEAALRESENRLRLALESTELGTWDLNPITGVLRWDDSCKAAFGLLPESEINYDVFLSALHPDDRDRTNQLVQFALNPESSGEFDVEYRTIGLEDGIERWIAAKGKAFFNPAGIATRFIGTVLNITEKKRAEAEREHLLQREQAARETAERANQVKDEFLAVLSHELRSPLNPILGWSKLLQSGKLDAAKTQQALKTIERNAQLQAELIEDLLDVSRILQGKLNLNVSPINLASIIRAAMETVRLAADAKSIQVEASFEPDVGSVAGDATRLQQVVWNLLSNAVKFTPPGGQVNIRLKRLDSYAYITVSDTGQGIAPDFLAYVFDYFRQADATTTRKFGGLGLGLAIVRHLVELHGGTVGVESPGVGMGATFTVRLPLMTIQTTANQNGQSSKLPFDLNGIRVLVVDDEPDSREFVAFVLEQAGAKVMTATTASEALATLERLKPDVLLSDIGMPQMDGYMLMQQVRALSSEQGGQIPAIALTAYAGEINYQQAMSVGFQRHISKPVEPEKLVEAIVSLLA